MNAFGSYLSKIQGNVFKKKYYEIFGSPGFGPRMRFSAIKSFLELNKNDIILDGGFGEGIYSLEFAINNNCNVIGIDLSKKNVIKAKKRAQYLGVSNAQFYSGDLCNLPFANQIFDKVVCLDVIEHIPNDDKAISELSRVLKENGEFILTVPHVQMEKRRFLYFGRAAEDHVIDGYNPNFLIQKLENNNFKIISIKYFSRYFEEISWEIGRTIRPKYPWLWAAIFPVLLILSKLDSLLPKDFIGNNIAIRAEKCTYCSKNKNGERIGTI